MYNDEPCSVCRVCKAPPGTPTTRLVPRSSKMSLLTFRMQMQVVRSTIQRRVNARERTRSRGTGESCSGPFARELRVFADGSCINNGSRKKAVGGIGVFFHDHDEMLSSNNVSRCIAPRGGRSTLTSTPTNQSMELLACSVALRAALALIQIDTQYSTVALYTDSMYAIDCCTKWIDAWERNGFKTASGAPVKNQDLIREVVGMLRTAKSPVFMRHVRAHRQQPDSMEERDVWYGNLRADELSRSAAKRGCLM